VGVPVGSGPTQQRLDDNIHQKGRHCDRSNPTHDRVPCLAVSKHVHNRRDPKPKPRIVGSLRQPTQGLIERFGRRVSYDPIYGMIHMPELVQYGTAVVREIYSGSSRQPYMRSELVPSWLCSLQRRYFLSLILVFVAKSRRYHPYRSTAVLDRVGELSCNLGLSPCRVPL